jgi:hypothetical protein
MGQQHSLAASPARLGFGLQSEGFEAPAEATVGFSLAFLSRHAPDASDFTHQQGVLFYDAR